MIILLISTNLIKIWRILNLKLKVILKYKKKFSAKIFIKKYFIKIIFNVKLKKFEYKKNDQ